MKETPLKTAKRQLKNAYITFINAHGTTDQPAVNEYLNNVQDSILKDINNISDKQKVVLSNSLANYNIKLRKEK